MARDVISFWEILVQFCDCVQCFQVRVKLGLCCDKGQYFIPKVQGRLLILVAFLGSGYSYIKLVCYWTSTVGLLNQKKGRKSNFVYNWALYFLTRAERRDPNRQYRHRTDYTDSRQAGKTKPSPDPIKLGSGSGQSGRDGIGTDSRFPLLFFGFRPVPTRFPTSRKNQTESRPD